MGRHPEPVAKSRQVGATIARPPLGKLYATQAVILLAVAAGLAWLDTTAAYSALLGGLISIGPNSYFARQAFRFRGALAGPLVARAFYLGETGKFVLTAIAFAVVFAVVKPLNALALWAAFLGMTLSHWLLWHRLLSARGEGER
jgi:ATP synthase protein I